MTRWLAAAREGLGALTKPTKPTEPPVGGTDREVLSVLSVLSGRGEAVAGLTDEARQDLRDAWEERAAIREYDGGQTREEAELEASRELALDVEYRDRPGYPHGC